MPTIWAWALASVFLVSLISLIGVFFISINEQGMRRILFVLVSLAVGGLFGDSFIHLLPEAFRQSDGVQTALYVLAGIFLFFILEKFLRWRHEHTLEAEPAIHPVGYINLMADGVHNLLDGMIIGAAYLVSRKVGIATTLAVILHEIPQEIGDFGILVQAGFTRKRALFFNFLSASLSILGALIALFLGLRGSHFSHFMAPLAAGGFIYIAGSDLLPELHKESKPAHSLTQMGAILVGAGLMLLLTLSE